MTRRGCRKAALATVATAATLMTTSLCLDVGGDSAAAHTPARGPLPLPTLPSPSVSVSLPPVKPPPVTSSPIKPPAVKPPATPSVAPPTGRPAPPADAPPTDSRPPQVGVPALPGNGEQMVRPGSAAAIIDADPAADLYPQPPVDPAVTPQARQVAALTDVQHRIQYLNNILARTRADLTRAQRDPDPMLRLLITLTVGAVPASDPDSAATLAAADSDTVDTATGRAAALSAAIASGQTELARRQQEETGLRREIDRRARLATVVAEPASNAVASGEGRLSPPLSGRLTSRFGNRFDPYYHVWQLHAGVDLAAPTGTPILAAAGGRVTRAGWYGGYGNYTCIDHGRADGQRLSTCYAHQSRLLVSPGQQVKPGQVIGRVGSTGASTGPHLHFEVRLGGRPVDPLPWI